MNLPINKATAEPRVYVDDDIYLYSPFISDHEYMDRMEKEKKSKEDEDNTWLFTAPHILYINDGKVEFLVYYFFGNLFDMGDF